MAHRIEVSAKAGFPDPVASGILRFAQSEGMSVDGVRRIRVYTIDHDLPPATLDRLARELFADPVVEVAAVDRPLADASDFSHLIEVGFQPGVMDTDAMVAQDAMALLGVPLGNGGAVYTSAQVILQGRGLTKEAADALAREYLANDNIQRWTVTDAAAFKEGRHAYAPPRVVITREPRVETVSLALDDPALVRLSKERSLALSLAEMHAIRDYFAGDAVLARRTGVGLPSHPTDAELEVFAQTWSEHCSHKIFNAQVTYRESPGKEPQVIASLFDTYIAGPTRALQQELPWALSALHDNGGVLRLNKRWAIVIKKETHNSPSNVEPFGGAETGIVGVYRDPMGTGMGARIIAGMYGFCTGYPGYDGDLRPRLHPRRLLEGVRAGVESGGNKSGVPTVYGQTFFDDGYMGKPAIFVAAIGLLPMEVNGKPGYVNEVRQGDRIVMAGGRVGIDGIHGATQSSLEGGEGVTADHVQIGNPFTQKKLADFLEEARDRGLYRCITDNGAGGLSSSVGEMARKAGGFAMDLAKVPLKYRGLHPWQILISESQERMTLAVDPADYPALQELAQVHDVEISNLGAFSRSGRFTATYGDKPVAGLDMEFLHHGTPRLALQAEWLPPEQRGLREPDLAEPGDYAALLHALLRDPNVASKEYIARQFDHEVQGTSVIKPLVGVRGDVFSDAAVIRPVFEDPEGVALAAAVNPWYGIIDTYAMAALGMDEAIRRVVAVGADPERIALMDNFCWPSPLPGPDNPDAAYKMAQLVRANQALREYALAFRTPFMSGKDSMSMDGPLVGRDGRKHRMSALPTLDITAVGVVPDVRGCVTMDVKRPGDAVYVLGITRDELGGSLYYRHHGETGLSVPAVDAGQSKAVVRALHQAMQERLVRSAAGCYRGGLGLAATFASLGGGYGVAVDLSAVPCAGSYRPDRLLFSESAGRYLVAVPSAAKDAFERAVRGVPLGLVGEVRKDDYLSFRDGHGFSTGAPLASLRSAWQAPFGRQP